MTESQRERVPRVDTGEKDVALAFLAFARHCVLKKLEGLDAEQLGHALPSGTTLLGLVRHLTAGERYWFGHVVGGDPAYADVSFAMDPTGDPAEVVAAYRAAIAASDELLAGADLDARTRAPADGDDHQTVRWVVAHMTGEVTRHAGHADVLRELVDGVTGR